MLDLNINGEETFVCLAESREKNGEENLME